MTLVLLAVLAQTPTLAVLTTRRTGGATGADGLAAARDVAALLASEGFTVGVGVDDAATKLFELGAKDPAVCEGRKLCVTEFGRQLSVTVMVGVSLGRLGSDVGVQVEALRSSDGAVLASTSFVLTGAAKVAPENVFGLAETLRKALGVPKPQRDAPKETALVPSPKPVEPTVVEGAPARSRGAGLALAVAAGAAVVAVVVLGALAYGARSELERLDAPGAAAHSLSEERALASRTNTLANAGIVVGVGAVALTGAAVLAW